MKRLLLLLLVCVAWLGARAAAHSVAVDIDVFFKAGKFVLLMELIMEKFETTNSIILPVIRYDKFYGFISKIDILEAYRQKLKEMTIE